MSDMNFSPLNPDEALHAFMDGELEITEEQQLFNELAASPELRTEMKDALSIRAAVHKDLLAPPATSESSLLDAVGLGAGAGAAGAGAAVVAATSTGIRALIATGAFSLVAGFLIAWFLLPREGGSDTSAVAGYSTQQKQTQQQTQTPTQQQLPAAPVRVDTVFAVRYVNKPVVIREVQQVEVEPTTSNTTSTPTPIQNTESEESIASMNATPLIPVANQPTAQAERWDVRTPMFESPAAIPPPVTMRVRTLASGLNADQPTPNSVQDAILPNTALALLYPLADNHRLGVELGTESFYQHFTGMEGNREVMISQTPVLFWMGATYQWTPVDFGFLPGLSAFVEATAGMAFKQGPIGRGAIGLAYQPFGPLRFTAGFDASALIYSYQGTSFTSSKWGFTYGLSFDLGALK